VRLRTLQERYSFGRGAIWYVLDYELCGAEWDNQIGQEETHTGKVHKRSNYSSPNLEKQTDREKPQIEEGGPDEDQRGKND